MNALKQLRKLALSDSRRRHPTLPESARYIKPYKDDTANNLTRAIIDYLRFSGHQAERINCTGRYLDGHKVITDTLGDRRIIGSGRWIRGSGQKGTSDVSAVINGKAVKIEIKIDRDRQSPDQLAYQQAVERAGGVYWLVRNFEEFKELFDSL